MPWMTVVADIHGRIIPVRSDSYLVLIAGDICPDGSHADQYEFLDRPFRKWLEKLPCPCVAVPGNHDKLIESGEHPTDLKWHLFDKPGMITIPSRDVVGTTTIVGIPGVLDKHYYHRTEEQLAEACLSLMFPRVDVLLTHCPALGILDRPSHCHEGSFAFRQAISRWKPKLHVCGHIHEARGYCKVDETYCVNATLGAGCDPEGIPVPAPHAPWGLADNSWRK